jgi:hypothetical protein
MTLNELITRKAKADALPDNVRDKYATEYAEVCDQIQAKLIDIAMACNEYTQTFIQNPEDIDALVATALALDKELSKIGVDLLEETP